MQVIFTKHANQRLSERNIKIKYVKETIEFPDYTITKNNKVEAHKKINDKTLKVVYIKEDKFIKIVTLIWK